MSDELCEINSSNISGIHVSVRIRPLSQQEINAGKHACCQSIGNSTVVISKEGDNNAYLKSQTSTIHEYAFDAVFDPTSTQEDVYNKSAKPYVNKAIIGENVTIFAYGTTGAGKTHTMFGNTRMDSTSNIAGGGVIPQTIQDLFSQINHLHQQNNISTILQDTTNYNTDNTNTTDPTTSTNNAIEDQTTLSQQQTWSVSFSYMEVYNEQVCDLLEPITGKDLPLREDPTKGVVHVVGLSEYPVANYDEVMDLLLKGQGNRKTEATRANAVSSRSHAIIQFTIVRTKMNHAGQKTFIESKLSLIDLAGSERASVTQSTGMRLQEGSNINKSLLALANCISALAERSVSEEKASNNILRSPSGRKSIKVKYRDSKLTHLLKGSLEGNCNLVMIANVNPADDTYDDTYHTLCYANRAKNLKVSPLVREQFEEITADKQLKLLEENSMLKSKIAELQATVQLLMEHRGDGDRFSISSGSSSTIGKSSYSASICESGEGYSRRSTIDAYPVPRTIIGGNNSTNHLEIGNISSINHTHNVNNNSAVTQNNGIEKNTNVITATNNNNKLRSSTCSSTNSSQEPSSSSTRSISTSQKKVIQKRQSNPITTLASSTSNIVNISGGVIGGKRERLAIGQTMNHAPTAEIIPTTSQSILTDDQRQQLYHKDEKISTNEIFPSHIVMNQIPTISSTSMNNNIIVEDVEEDDNDDERKALLQPENILEESGKMFTSTGRKRRSLSISNYVNNAFSAAIDGDRAQHMLDSNNKENELGKYVYPADPNKLTSSNHPPIKTRRMSNASATSTTANTITRQSTGIISTGVGCGEGGNVVVGGEGGAIVYDDPRRREDSIDGFAMIANERRYNTRLSNESNYRESYCSELTMEDNQSIEMMLPFGVVTNLDHPKEPQCNIVPHQSIPTFKEGNHIHLEISNPQDKKKNRFLTRFLCGVNQIKKIRKI